MSDTRVEWRKVYADEGRPGRDTLFIDGIARGDYYPAKGSGDVFRMRFWLPYRLQGGNELLLIGEERARQHLMGLAQKALEAEGEG
jgi:hypothetical protein